MQLRSHLRVARASVQGSIIELKGLRDPQQPNLYLEPKWLWCKPALTLGNRADLSSRAADIRDAPLFTCW